MPTITTEGFILKRSNFAEADRLLTVLTPYKGKVKMVAKGVRRITSRRSGNLEILNRVKIHVFMGKGMPLISEAESLQTFAPLKEDLTLSTYASHISEITDRFLAEDQPNPEVYRLFHEILNLLSHNPRQIFIRAYEIKLMSRLGFWSYDQVDVSKNMEELLQKLEQSSWIDINDMSITKEEAVELERILRYYMEKILEGSLKSAEVIKKIKEG